MNTNNHFDSLHRLIMNCSDDYFSINDPKVVEAIEDVNIDIKERVVTIDVVCNELSRLVDEGTLSQENADLVRYELYDWSVQM